MCKILLSYIFSFFNILFSQQPLLAHQLSHLPCWLPHSLWLGWWCQGQQHLNHLELLRNAESQAHPDLLTQHHVWTRSPSKVFSPVGNFWWVITYDFQELYFDSMKWSSWITQTPAVSEQEALECSVPLTLHIYLLLYYGKYSFML